MVKIWRDVYGVRENHHHLAAMVRGLFSGLRSDAPGLFRLNEDDELAELIWGGKIIGPIATVSL